MATKEQQHGEVKMFKGNGIHYNGQGYVAYFKGKQIGEFKTRKQAWDAIGSKTWGLK